MTLIGEIIQGLFFQEKEDHNRKGSYLAYVKRQFNYNRLAVFSLFLLYLLISVCIFADFLANTKPIVARYKGEWTFPVIQSYLVDLGLRKWPPEFQHVNWHELEYDFVIRTPVPYSPGGQDRKNPSVAPFGEQDVTSTRWRHWFGTDDIGRDLLGAMIHATRVDLSIGLVAMLIASIIGISLGSLAGFFGDTGFAISRGRLALNVLLIPFAIYYGFSLRSDAISDAASESIGAMLLQVFTGTLVFLLIFLAGNLAAFGMRKVRFLREKVPIPFDMAVSRTIEVLVSVPLLFLIIMVLAVAEQGSIFWVMVVIGLTRWTTIARFIRAELLRVRSLEYIESAHALGYSGWRVLIRHGIPNAMSPVFITIAFGIANAILIEAFLSFVGLGVPPDQLTWGSLLNIGRENPGEWWMALFPGLAIFITVTVFNLIGEGLTDALDPRQKH